MYKITFFDQFIKLR